MQGCHKQFWLYISTDTSERGDILKRAAVYLLALVLTVQCIMCKKHTRMTLQVRQRMFLKQPQMILMRKQNKHIIMEM